MAEKDKALWNRVVALHAKVEAELTKALRREHGLGLSDYRALSLLAQAEDGELRMQGLSDLIGLEQSSVTRLVARLEDAGLTERCLCPNDRRGIYSVITAKGRERQQQAEPTYEATLEKALGNGDQDLVNALRTAAPER
ncbi:MarR family transcriptional regulator [Lentzea sp. NBRC 105346]|uniref:MarR family winged helix-turn-helix transcriptional regulator n=1 Tax=Lentzea sp. NBRC 105346 TaxID=3032205 RepID=UPI0024A3ECC2|nr:MarR family transcriptional regulator [Lentzea sp. NBRC 105346]GLZ31364.1 MarR family transcriptional regulator [Lentzea sp. NBRC 105346]